MRRRMDNELHTEKEIGKDVRRILKGRDVSQRGSVPDLEEPEIFPGMEDVGIGVKQRRRSSRRAGYEDAAPQEADGYEDGYYEDPDDARAADSREGRRRPPEPRPRRMVALEVPKLPLPLFRISTFFHFER